MVFLPAFSAGASGVTWAASHDVALQKGAGRAEAMDREDGEASAGLLRAHRGYRSAQLRGEGHGQKESGRYVPRAPAPTPQLPVGALGPPGRPRTEQKPAPAPPRGLRSPGCCAGWVEAPFNSEFYGFADVSVSSLLSRSSPSGNSAVHATPLFFPRPPQAFSRRLHPEVCGQAL